MKDYIKGVCAGFLACPILVFAGIVIVIVGILCPLLGLLNLVDVDNTKEGTLDLFSNDSEE